MSFLSFLTTLFICLTFTTKIYAEDVVAEVNGSKITKAELEKYHQQNLRFVGQRKITKEVSLNDLINRELGIQKAKKNNLDKNPIVEEKLNDILFQAQTSKDLEDKLKKITVSDSEVKKFYDDNKEYRSAHILYRLPVTPTPDEVKKALDQSLAIYNKVRNNPDSFASLANKYSQTSAAPVGGDLGYQPPTRLPPEYYSAIKGKKAGFISKPVRSQLGFHIIKVLGVKTFDQIDKNVYKKIIYDQKRDQIIEDYYVSLRKGAKVNINKQML